jgi:CYTH domain-containing protein
MGQEIERKFLVSNNTYREKADGVLYQQGFLSVDPERVIRIRVVGEKATINIKAKGKGITRPEYEYKIPFSDAMELFSDVCIQPLIEKIRYRIQIGPVIWEVDEFLGDNEGLILAEVELRNEYEQVILPGWVGEEVTHDDRYYNNYLAIHPFKKWS